MKLDDFIKSEGVSPTEWARKNGLSQPVVSRFLKGKRGLSLKTALKIQSITGGMVRVDELFNGDR